MSANSDKKEFEKMKEKITKQEKEITELTLKLDYQNMRVHKIKGDWDHIKKCCERHMKPCTVVYYSCKDDVTNKNADAWECTKCNLHYCLKHRCQAYDGCLKKVECGYVICFDCFKLGEQNKKFKKEGKLCCRCHRGFANAAYNDGSFCSSHCQMLAHLYG